MTRLFSYSLKGNLLKTGSYQQQNDLPIIETGGWEKSLKWTEPCDVYLLSYEYLCNSHVLTKTTLNSNSLTTFRRTSKFLNCEEGN